MIRLRKHCEVCRRKLWFWQWHTTPSTFLLGGTVIRAKQYIVCSERCTRVARHKVARHSMRCYGMPRRCCWGWTIKDFYEGPRSTAYKRRLRRLMRHMARQAAKRALRDMENENETQSHEAMRDLP